MNMKSFIIYYSALFPYNNNTSRFILSDWFIFCISWLIKPYYFEFNGSYNMNHIRPVDFHLFE